MPTALEEETVGNENFSPLFRITNPRTEPQSTLSQTSCRDRDDRLLSYHLSGWFIRGVSKSRVEETVDGRRKLESVCSRYTE